MFYTEILTVTIIKIWCLFATRSKYFFFIHIQWRLLGSREEASFSAKMEFAASPKIILQTFRDLSWIYDDLSEDKIFSVLEQDLWEHQHLVRTFDLTRFLAKFGRFESLHAISSNIWGVFGLSSPVSSYVICNQINATFASSSNTLSLFLLLQGTNGYHKHS